MKIYSKDYKRRLCSYHVPADDAYGVGETCLKTATYACCNHRGIVVDRCDEHAQVFQIKIPIPNPKA